MSEPDPRSFLPLTPAMFHIMLALAGGERHGYRIMQEVQENSGGSVRLGPGTLYRTIRQMLAAGLMVEAEERPDPELDDQRRRYYRLTDLGRRVGRAEAEHIERLVQLARVRQLLDQPGSAGGAR